MYHLQEMPRGLALVSINEKEERRAQQAFYERIEAERAKERHIANKKFLERMRQDESMQQFDGNFNSYKVIHLAT